MTNLLVMVVFGYIDSQQVQEGGEFLLQMDWQTFAVISIAVGTVVLVGSFYKIMTLSAGGKAVAESLGGQLIPQDTNDLKQRKLLNVVQEMAIASGTPAPPVYLLTGEQGINAFAAGFTPRDAVIGVTQGTIDHLSRDQLQGVIAHEFSHIFNGDMRLNIRLMGILNGILIIGIIGYYMLYSASFSGRGRSSGKGAGGILALAIGLMVLGFAGTFFGGLIKAAVSRQREYLADASAVQFTRNPDGIAGALKRIGGLEFGSKIENPGAPEVSHAFFAQGISGFMSSLSATHPPLAKRIKAIDPHWDGKFVTEDKTDRQANQQEEKQTDKKAGMSREELANKMTTILAGAAIADVANAIDQIGNPSQETINHARSLISEMPSVVLAAASEPYGARAIIYSMVLDKGQEVRGQQLQYLQDKADPDVFVLTQKFIPEMEKLKIEHRLPLMDIAIPALKQLSINQYKSFRTNLIALIKMDDKVDLMEWSLQKILFNHLDGQFFKLTRTKARYSKLKQLKKETALVLSVLAHAGNKDENDVKNAFNAAAKTLDFTGLKLLAREEINLATMDRALKKLAMLKPLVKPQFLKACVASIAHDQIISPVEVELLRAFSDVLDCPMPPVKL
ncbi:MAG: M48 family metallopeptidase [Acidiferrobacterales bacterium]